MGKYHTPSQYGENVLGGLAYKNNIPAYDLMQSLLLNLIELETELVPQDRVHLFPEISVSLLNACMDILPLPCTTSGGSRGGVSTLPLPSLLATHSHTSFSFISASSNHLERPHSNRQGCMARKLVSQTRSFISIHHQVKINGVEYDVGSAEQ